LYNNFMQWNKDNTSLTTNLMDAKVK